MREPHRTPGQAVWLCRNEAKSIAMADGSSVGWEIAGASVGEGRLDGEASIGETLANL